MPLYLLNLEENPELERNHKVTSISVGGIPPQLHAEMERRWGVPVREGFGMTETGADMGVPLDDRESVGSGAMGKPVPTKEIRVVDEDDCEAPDGEIGELVIRGEPMMIGYWKKPEETVRGHARGLVSHRRSGLQGREGLLSLGRPFERHDSPKRGEYFGFRGGRGVV